jgi:hypothetical protein
LALSLNQRVQGSSPCAPTIDINGFGEVSVFNVRLIGSGEGEGTDFAVSLQERKDGREIAWQFLLRAHSSCKAARQASP